MVTIEVLQARARMLALVRGYFAERSVLEVETPLLCSSTAMDPYLESFVVDTREGARYLQTSPEFPMKRLLAAGSGSIYQVCKSFRVDEVGARHNPEFSMLEWYRVGWSSDELQKEVIALVQLVSGELDCDWAVHEPLTYAQLFESVVGLNPFEADPSDLAAVAKKHLGESLPELDRIGWLDLLMSQVVEPAMPEGLTMLIDFPAEQAALAKKVQNADGHWVAKRFELYVNGVELANGYQELVDAKEQRSRFEEDNHQRRMMGLPELPIPELLIEAMESGLPECAGVALGLDRLLMLALGKSSLEEVLPFTFPNA